MLKLELLKKDLKSYDKLCVGFSGGTDSSFLLKVAKDVLGENAIAILAEGVMIPSAEIEEAKLFAKKINVDLYTVLAEPLTLKEFRNNDKNRCYACKKHIFSLIKEKAKSLGITNVADGKNFDDSKVFRPGNKAIEELEVLSPLCKATLTKDEIRTLSKDLGLSTSNKLSNSCIATRFPYDTILTSKDLKKVELAELFLKENNILGSRVRAHGDIARIELPKEFFGEALGLRKNISAKLKELGFKYVCLDLEGFRSGSME